MNCIHHPWQPALGPCFRCGDYICLRCIHPEAADGPGPVCVPCAGQHTAAAEPLPFDGQGAWMDIVRATTLRVLKEPRRAFTRMADVPFDPAWRFAWAWSILAQVPLLLLRAPDILTLLFGPIFSALSVTLAITLHATLHHVAVLALGGRAKWKLSARAVGYAAPWWTLVTTLVVLLGAALPIPLTMCVVVASMASDVPVLWVLYVVGRHRQELSPARASIAAVSATLGLFVLKAVLIVANANVTWIHA